MTTATAENSTETTEHVADHATTGEKPSYDDINVPVIVLVGVISAILTFVTIVAVQGLCYQWQNSKIKDRAVVNMPARKYIDDQKKILDGGEGITSIDDAMKKVVDEFGK